MAVIHRHRTRAAAAAFVVLCTASACGGSEPAAEGPASPSKSPSTEESATPAGPSPQCLEGQPPDWVSEASHEADDVPDPAGRIFFGQIARQTDVLGQVIRPLFAVDADGSDLEQVLNCNIHRPRVSPDGTRLAFSILVADDTWQIATSAVDGSDLQVLTSDAGYSETPDWSPDGSWLVYSRTEKACPSQDWESCEGVTWSLWRMDADGGNQERIGEDGEFDWEPRLSPDGRSVVFTRMDFDPDTNLWTRRPRPGDRRGTLPQAPHAHARAPGLEPGRRVDHLQHLRRPRLHQLRERRARPGG